MPIRVWHRAVAMMDMPSEDIIRWTYVDISRAADATTEISALMAWDDGWQHRVARSRRRNKRRTQANRPITKSIKGPGHPGPFVVTLAIGLSGTETLSYPELSSTCGLRDERRESIRLASRIDIDLRTG